MRLRCIARYRSASRDVEVGQVLELTEAEGRRLIADAPGCWQDADLTLAHEAEAHEVAVEETEDKALDEPPADKMVKRPARSK